MDGLQQVIRDTHRSQGVWASAESYEPYMGVWSRQIARQFVDWLGLPTGRSWLDVGTGTGALVGAILEGARPQAVVAVDPAAAYLQYARERHPDARVRWKLADGSATSEAEDSFDASTCGLVLNFVPDPPAILREMARVTRPGGTVAAYVWDYGERMQILRAFWDVAFTLDPAARNRDEANRSTIWRPTELERAFRAAGLGQVRSTQIELSARYDTFEEYWRPFRGGQGTVASYAMALPEARRELLLARLEASLPRAADGKIQLAVRAFAVCGRVAEESLR
ncbi:MAG TPA: methyltransferase domain-containing protein [Polyangiaceae bacterium]|jgi:SAM-dependent methyltransferase|nr:methyltransferase domain-containing protein [Polyangiaceae bacterium]